MQYHVKLQAVLFLIFSSCPDVASYGTPLYASCKTISSSKQVAFGVYSTDLPSSFFGPPAKRRQTRRQTIMLRSKDDEDEDGNDNEEIDGGELTTETDWGGALAELRSRMNKINDGQTGGSAILFDMMSSMTPSQVITDFMMTAQPLVINAMSDAVAGLLGGLGTNQAMGIGVVAKVKGEKLGALCFQLQMTGYMFRNAEYVLALKELMSIEAHDVAEYKRAFEKIDKDKSGFIERDEIEGMLREVYGVDPPQFEQNTFLRFFDANNDGKISWVEFEKGLGVVNSEKAAGAVSKQFQFPQGSSSENDEDLPEDPSPDISGTISVELEDGKTIEVEAKDYISTLRAEADALKEALKREARDETANMGLTTGLDSGSPTAGGGLGGYLSSLNQDNVKALTEGITPDVVDTMKMLVKYVLDGGPNKAGAIDMEQEIDIPAGALQQLCLWQLVLGYRLREKEAEGDYKERLGK
ncbi:hypothetical protein TrCOL_g1598 [Triparma columacea]|uniref:EF-hand domain-containing protein n=1 Tax=Triparma columacea TaxID=722753 RepID=A0A9W7GKA9_9STRA|nr:hypothetical protein TrCOL_g1598 [Triparma columacea]